jgi:quinol monooxygenase YgiN
VFGRCHAVLDCFIEEERLLEIKQRRVGEQSDSEGEAKTKGRTAMDNQKVYLLAELTILPSCLDEVKAIFREAIVPTLQEPGCEALFETSREDDPHKFVFFEVFSSPEAHRIHLEQDYMKRMFSALEGKLAGAPIMTKLNPLWPNFF